MFLGEWAISINSKSWVLYPTDSKRFPLTASVMRAATLSWTMPYLVSIDKDSVFICLLNSCWQQGTEKIILLFHLIALYNA